MAQLTSQEITGFLIVGGGAMLISYLLLKFRNTLWAPLIFWCIGTTTWFIYHQAEPDPLWFTSLDREGALLGSLGCILFGLFIATQTFMMFELTAQAAGNNKNSLYLPLVAVMIGVLLSLIKAGYIELSIWWIFAPLLGIAAVFALALFSGSFDIGDVIGDVITAGIEKFGYVLLLGCVCMYIYTFADVRVSLGATLCGILFLCLLFMSSVTRRVLTGKGNADAKP